MDAGSLMMEVEAISPECSNADNQEVWDEQEEERAMREYVLAAREGKDEQARFVRSSTTAPLAENGRTNEVKVEIEIGEDEESGKDSSDIMEEVREEEDEEEEQQKYRLPIEEINRSRRRKCSKSVPNEKNYVCDICNKEYGNSESFRQHEKTHSDSDRFRCDFADCDRKYKSRYSLQTHQRRFHENIKPHACPECGKCFPESGILKRHTTIHTGEKPYECDLCGESFRFTNSLARHKNHAHGDADNPYTCEMCGSYFKDVSEYKEHTKLHWSPEPDHFRCHVCGREFRRKSFVREHVFSLHMNHSERGSVVCDVCQLQFPSNKRLMLHKRVHVENAMRCPKCALFFKSKLSLERHLRENCEDAKFRCQKCPRVFRYRVSYQGHLKKHSEEAMICPICGSRFASVALLAKHKRKSKRCHNIQIPGATGTHNTEFETKLAENTASGRAYTCLVCFKGFKYQTSHIKHQEKHVGEGAFSCPVCFQNFSYDSALNQHMKAHPGYRLPHWEQDGGVAGLNGSNVPVPATNIQNGLMNINSRSDASNVLLGQEVVMLRGQRHENDGTRDSVSNSLHNQSIHALAKDSGGVKSNSRGQRLQSSGWRRSELELRDSMTVADMKDDDHQFSYSLKTVKVKAESD